MIEEIDYIESHSPIPEEDENVEYIIINPRSMSDDESGSSKKRARWEYWETKMLIDIMKEKDIPRGDRRSMKSKENFFVLEQEMRKRGVERWSSDQIQQKWRNLRKDWFNCKINNYRNGSTKTMSEFQEDLDELLGTQPLYYSLSGIDTTSGDEVMGYEVEMLEPTDHLSVVIDNDEKMSRGSSHGSYSPHVKKNRVQQTMHDAKASSSSEEVQEVDSAHEPVKEENLKNVQNMQGRKDLFTWPHRGVLLLIKQYKKVEHEFYMGKKRHNKIWDDIATAICSMNHDLKVTGIQCQQKISGLKRTYLSIKENRSYARSEKITWPYFQIVDKIFGDQNPPRSSLVNKIRKKEPVTAQKIKHAPSSSSSDEEISAVPPSEKQSRVEAVLEQYVEDMKKHREMLRLRRERRAEERERRKESLEMQKMEQRRKRHEEKMAMQKAALDILKQILAKNS